MDIRIDIGFFRHPKTLRLVRELGTGAVDCLIKLWLYAAQYRCKGELVGMTVEDIAVASEWSDDPETWVKTLREIRFIDEKKGVMRLHNWKARNAFAFYAKERSEAARKSAHARWDKPKPSTPQQDTDNAERMRGANKSHTKGKLAPSPSPSPSPLITNDISSQGSEISCPNTRKPQYSDADLALAQLLNQNLIDNLTYYKPATPYQLESWANEIRLMRDTDLIPESDIRKVILWATAHHFWSSNIKSAGKLRKQFSTLFKQMTAPKQINGRESKEDLSHVITDKDGKRIF